MKEAIKMLREGEGKRWQRGISAALCTLALGLALYHIFTAFFGQPPARLDRSFCLTVVLIIIFATKPLGRKHWTDLPNVWTVLDALCILFVIFVFLYSAYNVNAFSSRQAMQADIVIALIYHVVVLDACRRAMGWPLVIIATFFLLQTHYAQYFPGFLYGASVNLKYMTDFMFLKNVGIFGTPMGACTTYIMCFVLLGSLLNATGAGQFFLDMANAITGRMVAGPAKAAVVASSLFGTVSGSAVANVVTTGTITIPLMKNYGLSPRFAGAVEAVASTGGQIMPPIMGASAFLIAQNLGLPYVAIIKAALIPAILYFFTVFVAVDFRARHIGLKPQSERGRNAWAVLKSGWAYLIPIVGLILMLAGGYSATKAAIVAIALLLFCTQVNSKTRISARQLFEALCTGIANSTVVVIACAVAGMVIGALELSGAGSRFTMGIVNMAGGNLLLALIFTMIAAIILGMGMPSIGVYVTLSALVIPALINMGVFTLGAHFFAFYYGILSFITPPVCQAAFAAASLAGADGMRVGWTAWRIALPVFMLPFMFVYAPGLLMEGEFWEITRNILTAVVGIVAITAATEGWLVKNLGVFSRLIALAAGVLLINGAILTDGIGLAALAVLAVANGMARKREQREDIPSDFRER